MCTVIRVNNLSKKYFIQHKQQENYRTLRDVITNNVRNFGKHVLHPFAKNIETLSTKEEFWALKNISFEVKQGERIGIIGRNGAGKSTLLKLISRITEPTEGRVAIRGRVASLLEVGTGFHPELTGRENIYLNGAILGMTKNEIQKKFDEIVQFAEVEKFLDTPVKRYSSGMYVRLAFSVAAHLDPEILIIDEVLAVGDIQFQKKCFGKIEDVGKDGKTLIFVSHNMNIIKQLCSKCILLENGILKEFFDTDSVVKKYLLDYSNYASIVDLENYKTKYGNNELSLCSIKLLNSIGGMFAAYHNQPLKLRIALKSDDNLSNVSFALGFYTIENILIFIARSENEDMTYNFKKGESRSIDIIINHNLIPGNYKLNLGIYSGKRVYSYISSDEFVRLELITGNVSNYITRNDGIIICKSDWK